MNASRYHLAKTRNGVNWQSVKPFVEVSPFAQSYEKRKDLTLRAVSAKQLSDPVSPGTYLTWTRRHDIRLPDDLINCAVNNGISIEGPADPTPTTSDQTLGAKERESLLKLVIGMAVRGYKFDPGQARNQAEICDDILLLGLSIDEDTVRKYLKQASQLLDGDAPHNLPRKPNSVKR